MSKETILVVDDNSDLLALLEMLLKAKYNVIKARDGHQGLVMAQSENPDLIILDMNMPRMNGIEMLAALRDTTCNAPIIFITAAGSEHLAAKAFRLGVYDYLVKPFGGDTIEESINRALSKTRLAHEKDELEEILVVADTVRQTVTTLAHHINNQLMVINGGLTLMQENTTRPGGLSTYKPTETILHDCINSADRIQAVLRVMQKLTTVELTVYHEETQMLNIEDAVRKELALIQKE